MTHMITDMTTTTSTINRTITTATAAAIGPEFCGTVLLDEGPRNMVIKKGRDCTQYGRCRLFCALKILLILHTEEHLQSIFCG